MACVLSLVVISQILIHPCDLAISLTLLIREEPIPLFSIKLARRVISHSLSLILYKIIPAGLLLNSAIKPGSPVASYKVFLVTIFSEPQFSLIYGTIHLLSSEVFSLI